VKGIEQHYRSVWGKPSRTSRFFAKGRGIRVHKWDSGVTDEGVALYATDGASDGGNQGPHRAEFVVGLLPSEDAVMSSLAGLGVFPSVSGEVNKGDTIWLGSPLWPGAGMSAFMTIPAVDDFIPTIELKEFHVEFLRVLPVYDSEIELKKIHGASWLMRQLHAQGMLLSDPLRSPVRAGAI
jgi:hypothetical protein